MEGVQDMDQSAIFEELRGRLTDNLRTLADKPEETPLSTLQALWHTAADFPVSARMAGRHPLPVLTPAQAGRLRELVGQRLLGVPLAHLTGRQSFMGIELYAGPQALIPRQETEMLGHAALEILQNLIAQRGQAVVVDVCTGSGNLAVSLASLSPKSRVFASDISADAVGLARKNALLAGVSDRVELLEGDFLEPFRPVGLEGKVDVLVCNPPYISSQKVATLPVEIAEHEPAQCFDGGPFGASFLRRLITAAPDFLTEGGALAFEVGRGQGEPMLRQLTNNPNFKDTRGITDTAGNVRAIVAYRCIG
ncbi:MAG: peptide chain release factor N(5)-glutamine methyltransferase [Pseudomonadota bacterium]